MVDFAWLLEFNSSIFAIAITLSISLLIMVRAVISIIEKKRILVFRTFFIFGMGLCMVAGFMFYGFYGVAVDVYTVMKLVFIFGVFVILIPGGNVR